MKQKNITTVQAGLDGITNAINGATEHGVAIGLKHNTVPVLTGAKTNLVNADTAARTAKALLQTRKNTAASILLTAISFLMLARDMLKPRFGTQYSSAWDIVGFVGSLKIPRSFAGLKLAFERFIAFLTANADAQSAEKNITAERAQQILDDMILKQGEVISQRTVVRNALKNRSSALGAVAKRIGSLVGEIGDLVLPLDTVYLSFGLNIPGAMNIPSVPTNLLAVLIGATAAALKWDRSERAERYRVWKKVVGVDEDFVAVETRDDLDFVLEGLPANATVEIAVSAVNSGGESAKSEKVVVQTV